MDSFKLTYSEIEKIAGVPVDHSFLKYKKKPFLTDPEFLKYKSLEVCDEADNGIRLWYLPFEKGAETVMARTEANTRMKEKKSV